MRLVLLWLLSSRGISPITGTRNAEHMVSNLSVQNGTSITEVEAASVFAELAKQREMVDMMGGCDEYAGAFADMTRNSNNPG